MTHDNARSESPYREALITRERHEEIVADVCRKMQAIGLKRDMEEDRRLRLEGAEAILRAGIDWLERNPRWDGVNAGRFIIWLLRAVSLSNNGKHFNVEVGRMQE